MFGIGTQEILFILLIVLLFFGGKKIPELMKGFGKGVKSFRDGMNGVENPSYRRHAVVVILVAAAVITPTSDVFTLMLVGLPMWLLYEAGIYLVKVTEKGH